MKVSVIIPVFNGEADLPDLLGTLQAQTYSADLVEYLFVDNNSHDRTGSYLEAAVADFQHLGLTLKVYREARIQSSYAARNTARKSGVKTWSASTWQRTSDGVTASTRNWIMPSSIQIWSPGRTWLRYSGGETNTRSAVPTHGGRSTIR